MDLSHVLHCNLIILSLRPGPLIHNEMVLFFWCYLCCHKLMVANLLFLFDLGGLVGVVHTGFQVPKEICWRRAWPRLMTFSRLGHPSHLYHKIIIPPNGLCVKQLGGMLEEHMNEVGYVFGHGLCLRGAYAYRRYARREYFLYHDPL